jgi:hypothetical protein
MELLIIFGYFLIKWCLKTCIVMALWNWLIASFLGAPEITFWMAAGLMLLVDVLISIIKK